MIDRSQFQGFQLPRFLRHGTTESYVNAYTQPNGSYKPPFPDTIDAKDGDVRAWPREESRRPRATIVIDTKKAYSGLLTVFPHSFWRFSFLPAGSFRVLRESECSFELGEFGVSEYNRRISELERKLLDQYLKI